MAASFHGSISTFDATQEDWVEYAEHLQRYFVANKIVDEDIQHAILLTNVGPSTYRLAKTLSLPRKPMDYTFDDLVKLVTAHFHPKPSPIIKRFEFNTRSQEEGESVAVFVAALRSIAEHCQYPEDILPDMLRDRIVFLLENGRKVKKDADQIIICTEAYDQEAESTDDNLIEDHTVIPEDNSVPDDDAHSPPTQPPITKDFDQDDTQSPSPPLSPSHPSNLPHSTSEHSVELSEQENKSTMDYPVRRSNRSRHLPKRYGTPLHY
uniref:Retrotransposon gag domain-containing protein n=1 Tax=Amphimedon queenslandica TaxID=400682 RepID=A0A1X7VMX8_AMPQE